MKTVTIIAKKNAISKIHRIVTPQSLCYYLTDDYAHFTDLRDKFRDKMEIKNLSGMFQETFQEIKEPFLEVISNLNKEYDSLEWWGGELATGNTASTPLLLNITYLFCIKKILLNSKHSLVFIVNSHALSESISTMSAKAGYKVVSYSFIVGKYLNKIKCRLYCIIQILYFFWQAFESRRAALKLLKPLAEKKVHAKKRVVIRTMITNGTFDKFGKFQDRNFGHLSQWLRSKNYEVWTLPLCFNLSMSMKELYTLMKNQEQPFLIPDYYLKFSDYLRALYLNYKMLRKKIKNIVIKGTNVTSLFNEILERQGFFPSLLRFNLCLPLLKRLKERGTEIDAFYYPFEGNVPEKTYILSCRKYFPNSRIVGFQHTAFYPNQLACHLGTGEKDYHPLPDVLVCSGPVYIKLLEGARFPKEILVSGPNLRYQSVYLNKVDRRDILTNEKKRLMLPLTFSYDLAFELFVKVKEALKDVQEDYKVYIRSHPLLSKKTLINFLNKIGMKDYGFADDGVIQDWLPKMYAMMTMGGSITTIESIVMATPIIRVIPDNTIFFDPFTWPDYPLKPVNASCEVKQQLEFISELIDKDEDVFMKIGNRVLNEYFTKPTEENMNLFL